MPLRTAEFRSPMPASAADVFAWHARPAAFVRLIPPWESVTVAHVEGPFGDGQRVTLRAKIAGPVAKDWVAELFDVVPGKQFRDRELAGPFASWQHTHAMADAGPGASELRDAIEYRLPFGRAGDLAGGGLVRGKLAAMFRYRHAVTAGDLARHALFPGQPLTVAVTGSNGLIGSALCAFLAAGGHAVRRLVRSPEAKPRLDGTTAAVWNPAGPLDPDLLAGVDAVVHLAGDGVADGRWSAAKKARIRDSRIGPTRHVAEAVARAGVRTLLSGSAVGIYGSRGDAESDESSPARGRLFGGRGPGVGGRHRAGGGGRGAGCATADRGGADAARRGTRQAVAGVPGRRRGGPRRRPAVPELDHDR